MYPPRVPKRPAAKDPAVKEHELAADRLRTVMGFCPGCAADFLGGFPHTPDCELREDARYAVRPAAPKVEPERQVVRLGGGKLAHLKLGERTACGEHVLGGHVMLPASAKVTCRRCCRAAGLPVPPKRKKA